MPWFCSSERAALCTLGLSSTMTHVKAISGSIAEGRGIAHSS
jgi:hypothetical protein